MMDGANEIHGCDRKAVGNAIRKLRLAEGWTQGVLSKRAGIHLTALNFLENGIKGTLSERKLGYALSSVVIFLGCGNAAELIEKAETINPQEDIALSPQAMCLLQLYHRLSQQDVAKASGLTEAAISLYSRGIKGIGLKSIPRVSAVFGCASGEEMVSKAIGIAVRCACERNGAWLEAIARKLSLSMETLIAFQTTGKGLSRSEITTLCSELGYDNKQDLLQGAIDTLKKTAMKNQSIPEDVKQECRRIAISYLKARFSQSDEYKEITDKVIELTEGFFRSVRFRQGSVVPVLQKEIDEAREGRHHTEKSASPESLELYADALEHALKRYKLISPTKSRRFR